MTELYAHKTIKQAFYDHKTKYFSSTKKSEERDFSVSHSGDRNQPLNPDTLKKTECVGR